MTSAYSKKIASQKRGFYKVADLQGDIREITHTISHLLQDQVVFDEEKDILCFTDTGRQLQVNVTNADTLITLFGDEPERWSGHRVTLYLAPYGKEGKLGIRLKAPDATQAAAAGNGTFIVVHNLDDEIPF